MSTNIPIVSPVTISALRPPRVVVVFESLVSAARALRACECAFQEVRGCDEPDVAMWRMEALDKLPSRRRILSSALHSDLLILSTSLPLARDERVGRLLGEWESLRRDGNHLWKLPDEQIPPATLRPDLLDFEDVSGESGFAEGFLDEDGDWSPGGREIVFPRLADAFAAPLRDRLNSLQKSAGVQP